MATGTTHITILTEGMVTGMAGVHSTTTITITTTITEAAASLKNPTMPGGREARTTSLRPIPAPPSPRVHPQIQETTIIITEVQETGGITVATPTGAVHPLQEAEVMETVAREEVLPEAADREAAADRLPVVIATVVHLAVAAVQEGVNFSTGKQNETSFSYLF